jgi:hypothetical protein
VKSIKHLNGGASYKSLGTTGLTLYPNYYYKTFLYSIYKLDDDVAMSKHAAETEHCVRVVNNPTLYSGDPGFKSRPGDRIS